MAELRNYDAWHAGYEDPGSTLSWRLARVRAALGGALDAVEGPVRLISACAGDGRDVIGTLAERGDADRVTATLLELHPEVAERSRLAAAAAGIAASVEVRTVDAGSSDAYLDLVPAQVVLLVGIFGNISDEDVRRTIAACPQLCAPGATVIWSRGRGGSLTDRNDVVRSWFRGAGFSEVDYVTLERGSKPAIGVARYQAAAVGLVPGLRWFSFQR